MPHILETGTDVASILIFDPQALPSDFDARPDDQYEIIGKLHEEKRIFHVETGADGSYLIHAFVDEPIPDCLKPFLREPYVHERFEAPSGRIYCAGLEYAFHADDSLLKKYPHMGNHFLIAPGTYHLTMYRTEYPDDMMESELKQKAEATAFKLHQGMGCFVGLAVIAFIACAVSFFKLSTALWAGLVLPLTVLFIAAPFVVTRLPAYRRTDNLWQTVQRKYPSLVAEFRSRRQTQGT